MNAPLHLCTLCGDRITENERWEYAKGAYPVGTLEAIKRRVHVTCIARLTREVIEGLARVTPAQQEDFGIET